MKFKIPLLILASLMMVCLTFTASATAVPIDIAQFTILSNDAMTSMMFGGIILNKANLTIIFQAFNTAFKKGLGLHESQWQRIATLVPSSAKEEKYAWLGQWPRLRKWIGDRQIKSLSLSDYSIKNEPFEATVAIPKDDIEDDSYGVYSPLMEEMGSAANDHPDELVFGLLGEGFTKPCFDGQFFFDTDHPVGDASVSNMQAGAGAAWFLLSTRRALKPIIFQRRKDYTFATMTSVDDEAVFMRKEFRYGIDARVNVGFGLWQTAFGSKATLDASNFEAAIVAGMSLETDEGRKLGIKYDLLVVGPGNFAAAKALIEKATLAGGEDNTNYKAVELLVVPWLN